MKPTNRRGFFAFIGQCIAAAFVAPAVLPKVAEAIEVSTLRDARFYVNGVDLSSYVKPVTLGQYTFLDSYPPSQINSVLTQISLQYINQPYIVDVFPVVREE